MTRETEEGRGDGRGGRRKASVTWRRDLAIWLNVLLRITAPAVQHGAEQNVLTEMYARLVRVQNLQKN